MIVINRTEEELAASPCSTCVHSHTPMQQTCEAFPAGIPDEIWSGQNPHTAPHEGDHGIVYEPPGALLGEAENGHWITLPGHRHVFIKGDRVEDPTATAADALAIRMGTFTTEKDGSTTFTQDPETEGEGYWGETRDGRRVWIKGRKDAPVTQDGRPSVVQERITKFAEMYGNDTEQEHLLVVAADGSVVFAADGTKNGVSFTPEDAAQFPGCYMVHNHPSDNSFSFVDIQTTLAHGLTEHVVISPSYVFEIEGDFRKKSEKLTVMDMLQRVQAEYRLADTKLYPKYLAKVRAKELTEAQASIAHTNEQWEHVAKNVPGVFYRRRPKPRGGGV